MTTAGSTFRLQLLEFLGHMVFQRARKVNNINTEGCVYNHIVHYCEVYTFFRITSIDSVFKIKCVEVCSLRLPKPHKNVAQNEIECRSGYYEGLQTIAKLILNEASETQFQRGNLKLYLSTIL